MDGRPAVDAANIKHSCTAAADGNRPRGGNGAEDSEEGINNGFRPYKNRNNKVRCRRRRDVGHNKAVL